MSGGYSTGRPMGALADLVVTLEEVERRLDTLERPSGEQLAQVVEELSALVNDIQAQLDDYIANDAYTKAQVDALVASPGNIAPGNVNASGTVTGAAGIKSVGAYDQLVTYGGSYRALWVHQDGTFGYAPSSADFKTEPEAFVVDLDDVLKLHAVTYRYLPTSPYAWGREELGGIAQDVAAAGFPWLVDYDDDGQPFGIRNDLLSWVLLEGMRELARRVAALEGKRR